MKCSHLANAAFVISIIFLLTPVTLAQPNAAKDYENLQQALRLLPILEEVNKLEDAAMRTFLRYTILEFVYSQNIAGVFETADSEVLRFYDELSKSRKLFSPYRVDQWQNVLLTGLRKYRPHLAKQIEAVYLANEDTSLADHMELLSNGKVSEIVDRTIERIRRGGSVGSVAALEQTVRKKDPTSADRILAAIIERDEGVSRDSIPLSYRISFENLMRPPGSPELRLRYIRFVVKLARIKIADEKNKPAATVAITILKSNLDRIKELSPDLYPEAQALLATVRTRMTPAEIEWDNASRRINESDDKPGRAVIEAEATDDLQRKDSFLFWAMRLAVEAKQFRRAVDIAMKARPGPEANPTTRDMNIWFTVMRGAVRAKDLESADYAVSHIESDVVRAAALSEFAREFVGTGRHVEAIERIRGALKLLENNELDRRHASYAFNPVYPAFLIGTNDGSDTLRRAIAIANRLPAQKPDERVGTEGYMRYADSVLIATASAVSSSFNWLSSRDSGMAEFRAQEIAYRPWKLMAHISIERNRRHPLPQKT